VIARPYFYRDVTVSVINHPNTLRLLSTNDELAKVIVSFKVTMAPVPRWNHQNGLPWPTVTNKKVLAAIYNMSSLEELEMVGSIFSFASEQQRFLEHFKAREKPLKKFSFTEGETTQLFPGDTFDLPNLTSLTWSSCRDSKSSFSENTQRSQKD
jgi:hypothetical protein